MTAWGGGDRGECRDGGDDGKAGVLGLEGGDVEMEEEGDEERKPGEG